MQWGVFLGDTSFRSATTIARGLGINWGSSVAVIIQVLSLGDSSCPFMLVLLQQR